MDPFLLLLILAAVMLVIGSITDIRWRIVPDWISYTAITTGIVVRLLWSVLIGSPFPLLEGLLGLGVFFLLACVAFYTRMWGGGDSKVLMGLGALLGLWWNPTHPMLSLVMNFLLVGGLYGMGYFVVLALGNLAKVSQAARSLLGVKAVGRAQIAVWAVTGFVVVWALLTRALPVVILAFGFAFIFYLFILSKAVESVCFVKKRSVKDLEEGDWVVEPVVAGKKVLASPDEPGLTKEQIAAIKRSKIRAVMIKEGIPFIPNFFIAFVVTVVFGNLFLRLVEVLAW